MSYSILFSAVSLVFQMAVFVLLLSGYALEKKQRLREHGIFMFAGVALHILAIAVIMVPSFISGLVPFIAAEPTDVNSVLSLIHAGTGIAVAVLGVWIVGSWRLRQSPKYCAPMKKWMRPTLIMWLVALVSGFLLYLSFYWTTLFG
jgi:uncharacterized membrane protein YozB (DUF420 family)